MKNFLSLILLFMILLAPVQSVGAAQSIIWVENPRHDVPTIFAYDVRAWLETNRPAETNIYAVMNYSFSQYGEFVSLAGLDPSTPPPYDWNLEDGNVIWTGSLERIAGLIQLNTPTHQPVTLRPVVPLASLFLPLVLPAAPSGPGGGPDVYFPWASGTRMMFGDRGVHGGGFGLSNAVGIDWVSGDDFGNNAAPSTVFASASGEVTATCPDDTSMAVLIDNGDNKIGYYHLKKDPALVEGRTFAQGEPIGSLVYGSFDDECGWASQQPDHYHLHWVIEPAAGKFQAEGWQLKTGDAKWTRGNEMIKVRQWLTGGGGFGGMDINPDDPSSSTGTLVITPGNPEMSGGGGAHIWDYMLLGVNVLYTTFKTWYIPGHYTDDASDGLWQITANMTATMIQDANLLLVNDTINLMPWFWVAGVILGAELIRWAGTIAISLTNLLARLRGAFKWW